MGKLKIKKSDVWIDMTPMSDVMVLLLTFFMLSSNFVKNEAVKVITPQSEVTAKVPTSDVLDITIDPQGRVLMSTDKTSTLQGALEEMRQELQTVGVIRPLVFHNGQTNVHETILRRDGPLLTKTPKAFNLLGQIMRIIILAESRLGEVFQETLITRILIRITHPETYHIREESYHIRVITLLHGHGFPHPF